MIDRTLNTGEPGEQRLTNLTDPGDGGRFHGNSWSMMKAAEVFAYRI